ncbi:SIR2 family protein [Paenibacillus sp. UNC499MF]|uniref:SIR2 family NAD-dependent protein deacylase n=1 Tax=Paenibacillus sp. UNC499MF TaxID=1502751 RepID=UPI00089FC9B4|nr:SIR2 family protein [Paenibacillus sp. UNC499MF]SEG75787.1 SIR2-like domain-containing protein [Paenibacillus sp. UNC499MF]
MQINWPVNLVEEIAYRRCVLFLGAGISATSKNDLGESPKKWGEFIQDAVTLLHSPTEDKLKFIKKMIEQGNYLLALQSIYDSCDPGNYANYLRQVYSRPNYKASQVHELIKSIDSKIVITTNFDKIYENLCNEHGYTTAMYRDIERISTNMKSTENLIIKAHGSIDDVDSLVFTQKQYYKARKDYPQFYQILNALFITKTIVFLGYSLNDPDINLVLETVGNASSSSSPHYVVVKQGVDEEIKKYWRECYNIYPLEYGPTYQDLDENILRLHEKVREYREIKRLP